MANGQERKEETYAMQILLRHFPQSFSSELACCDMPDLQDAKKDIGIEVVRSFHTNQGKALGILGRYINRPVDKIPHNALSRMRELGFRPIIIDNVLKSMSSGFYTPTPLSLLEEIDKKIEKLQGPNYRIFRKNRLFVFVLNPVYCYTRNEIRQLVRAIKEHQKNAVPKFDAVYIYDSYNGIYDLWVCYPQSETIRKYRGVPLP